MYGVSSMGSVEKWEVRMETDGPSHINSVQQFHNVLIASGYPLSQGLLASTVLVSTEVLRYESTSGGARHGTVCA